MQSLSALVAQLQTLQKADAPLLVAIDGRCGSGKSTLAAYLQAVLQCNVVHMDAFFLRPMQRTPQRLQEPGGNVDYERFYAEVAVPLKAGHPLAYRAWDCKTSAFSQPICLQPRSITLVEGSYSCHPYLWDMYDFRLFLTVSPALQRLRIRQRNGEVALQTFLEKWIPMEEQYFAACDIARRCDDVLQMDQIEILL